MESIEGPAGPPSFSPEEIDQYKKGYEKSFEIFRQAFTEYDKPNLESHKKGKLEDVMNQALHVMNEVAYVALKKGKRPLEVKLNESYQAFIDDPTPENRQHLIQDMKSLEDGF